MAAIPNESKIPVGTVLVGKYRVSREIGRGGMAAVYEAEHLALEKRVAIKVLAAELTASKVVSERFFREARAAASIKSPHIVDVYDTGRLEDGRPFIVMELLEGESLYDRMARVRLMEARDVVKIITDCAKGLLKAHAVGIVHRDLKPENIFLFHNEDGEEMAKILDFGLAKFYAPMKTDEKTARLTREGAVFGTPAYMSPEQVKGQGSVDHRSDLWALGCMTYECLTGRPVWNMDQGVAMTFAAIATEGLPTPTVFRPDLPPSFDAWFRRALERDPDRRFSSAKELADALAVAIGAPSAIMSDISLPRLPVELREQANDLWGPQSSRPNMTPSPISARIPAAPGSSPMPLSGAGSPPSSDEQGRRMRLEEPAPSTAQNLPSRVPPAPPLPAAAYQQSPSGSSLKPLIAVLGTLLVVGGGAAAYFVAQPPAVKTLASASASASASSAPTTAHGIPKTPETPEDQPPWATILADGQKALASGDVAGAGKKFKEATAAGAGPVGKSFEEALKTASAGKGSCRLTAFGHPRLKAKGNAGRPFVAQGASGLLYAWTDEHEQAGQAHVYSVQMDESAKVTSNIRDLTPEAEGAARPILVPLGGKTALFFADEKGKSPGVFARWLDSDGRIAGESMKLGGTKAQTFNPWVTASKAAVFVLWEQEGSDRSDLFLRRLSPELALDGPEVRLTDLAESSGTQAGAHHPTGAVAGNTLFVGFRFDEGMKKSIGRFKVPAAASDLGAGVTSAGGRRNHVVGDDLLRLAEGAVEAPSIACGNEGCFVVWHQDGTDAGAYAALLDGTSGKMLWHKKFAKKGGHPNLAVSAEGNVSTVFFDDGQVLLAALTRDGVGVPSSFAKVAAGLYRPVLAPGKGRGDWLVAWLDAEAGHTEAFVAKLACSR